MSSSPVTPAAAVLVADELRPAGRTPVPCPAHPLLAGDLRRQGYQVTTGPVAIGQDLDSAGVVFDETTGLGVTLPPIGGPDREAVERSLAEWAALARPRHLLLASPRSFCAGVERAIQAVEELLDRAVGPVYVRKQIVHNTHVVRDLESRGAVFVEEVAEIPPGATVVFSAHGVAPAVYAEAAGRDLRVVDAVCPLVSKVHAEARRFATAGDTVVLIGHAGHEEAEGTLGQAPSRTVLVQTVDDVARLDVADPSRVAYLTQTTLAVDEVTEVTDALRRRFPALKGPGSEDICYATTNRQVALRAVLNESDVVLVVGSANSSNSLRLVELAERQGTAAYLIDDAGDIRPDWLTGADTVGLTAGASAPPGLVSAVITALNGLGAVRVTERETSRETVRFALPSQVRRS